MLTRAYRVNVDANLIRGTHRLTKTEEKVIVRKLRLPYDQFDTNASLDSLSPMDVSAVHFVEISSRSLYVWQSLPNLTTSS